jgi:PAS domain S-box-containing protein
MRPRFHAALNALLGGEIPELDLEFRIRHANGDWVWVWQRGLAVRNGEGRVTRTVGALLDITDRKRMEAAIRESEARFRHMADSAPALIWMTDAQGRNTFANMHFDYLFGLPAGEMLEKGWASVVVEEDYPAFSREFREAFAVRRPFRSEIRVRDKLGQTRWLRCEGVARLDDAGAFLGYTGCAIDISDAKVAQEGQLLLINELNHRVKNTLATVQSIASQTLRNAVTTEQARHVFEARLIALSRAHDVLTRENWEGAALGEVVAQAIEPYRSHGEHAFRAEGPDIRLSPTLALALAMALQELATNAVKYGALSIPSGRVRIGWQVEGSGKPPLLRLTWEETGGPKVVAPSRRGFGSKLIERTLAQDPHGEVQLTFAPTGVICSFRASLA